MEPFWLGKKEKYPLGLNIQKEGKKSLDEKEHIISSMILKAQEKCRAKLLFANGIYDDSVSRAYYAAFHAVSAVLFLNGFSFLPIRKPSERLIESLWGQKYFPPIFQNHYISSLIRGSPVITI